jgi:colicin import membrane protein
VADAKAKAVADAKAKAVADAKAKAVADAKAKAVADAKKRETFEQQLAAKLKSGQSDKAVTNAINQAPKATGSSDKTASAQAKTGSGLSFSDKSALIDKMAKCWTEQGASKSTVVDFDLNQTGVPYNFQHTGGDRTAFLMAQEAIKKCGPYGNLPAAQYESWKNLRVKFSPFGLDVQ